MANIFFLASLVPASARAAGAAAAGSLASYLLIPSRAASRWRERERTNGCRRRRQRCMCRYIELVKYFRGVWVQEGVCMRGFFNGGEGRRTLGYGERGYLIFSGNIMRRRHAKFVFSGIKCVCDWFMYVWLSFVIWSKCFRIFVIANENVIYILY